MVYTYYEIGNMIVEEEQKGKKRAEYGKQLLKQLSLKLSKEFGKGFAKRNLELIRQFYLTYSQAKTEIIVNQSPKTKSVISQFKKSDKPTFLLSWTHYIKLMRIEKEDERNFYEIESVNNKWSVRELERQYNKSLYERLVLSTDKEGVKKLSKKGQIIEKPKDAVKDPLVLDFLGFKQKQIYTETGLEQKITDKLEYFLLELGKGFTFVARQKRISFDDKHFYIDLVFYNRLLKCFVIIDLKIGELKHQDLGQLQMYVNYYDREIKLEDENPTIGIILCKQKSDALVRFTLPLNENQIFASKYETVLPSKDKLKQLIENRELDE